MKCINKAAHDATLLELSRAGGCTVCANSVCKGSAAQLRKLCRVPRGANRLCVRPPWSSA
jgi:hypothetical protein